MLAYRSAPTVPGALASLRLAASSSRCVSDAAGSPATWGSFVWGGAPWGQATGYFRQYTLPWTAPIVFKQMSILAVGASQGGFAIGNLYLKYQPLGYLLDVLGAA